jgi:ParB-like chromosome segregation protein Spo0J
MTTVNRRQIQEAPYNPRKITETARKKLQKFIKDMGLLGPLIVNRRTWRIVGGHQRLKAQDALIRKDDYELNVALVDLTDEEEVRANIALNNTGLQGEFDVEALVQIHVDFPDLKFTEDLGFDQVDLDFLFADTGHAEMTAFGKDDQVREEVDELEKMRQMDKLRQAKADYRAEQKEKNLAGESHGNDVSDNVITFVFPNNVEKRAVCEALGLAPTEKFVRHTVLFELSNGAYDLMH